MHSKSFKTVHFFKYLSVVSALFLFSQAFAQFGAIRQIEKNIEEKNWSKSRQLIDKLLVKDSLNMEARMVLSKWFLNTENPSYQFDSAYHQIIWALQHFSVVSARQKDRLKKEAADSSFFVQLYLKIDSLAFEQAKIANTESGYQKFIVQFPDSHEKERAIELRDEAAYLNALKINTYFAFADYLKKYPESSRSQDTNKRYDQLILEYKTKDK